MFCMARALLAIMAATAVTAQSKNLLFYGNSYTFYSWGYGVPELVGWIAEEAGHAPPTIVQALLGGSDLQFHATDPNQIAIISNALPAGQSWDHVVIQGNSLDATPYFGFSVAGFRSNAATIAGNVRNHSPNATAVLYQTWARAWGHMYYPLPWAVPMDMHNMVRGNYDLAVDDINTLYGAGTAAKAAVGDAVALLEWNPSWYDPDLSHPTPSITLLAAMCLYTTIYNENVCDIDPNFAPTSPLAIALAPHSIDATTWTHLAGVADRSAHASVRRYPGSADHLLLESATDSAPLAACPLQQITSGTQVQLQMRSMNGVYDGAIGWLLVDFMNTGLPPGPSLLYPEIQIDVGRMIATPATALSTPLVLSFQMPFTLPGGSFLVQGLAVQPSAQTGNPVFTTTDAHELVCY
jgi:hypothetical protein